MTELHIFIDESGDLGFSKDSAVRFILSFVFHDARDDISENIRRIKNLEYIHVGPLIRREEPYLDLYYEERSKLFRKFFAFFVGLPIKSKSFIYDKKPFKGDTNGLKKQILDDLSNFFTITNPYLASFDKIVIYYDKGQQEVSDLLHMTFSSSGLNHSFKEGVKAKNYRLFQVADLIAMIKLIECKMNNNEMSNSEKMFFGRLNRFNKEFLKAILKKEI